MSKKTLADPVVIDETLLAEANRQCRKAFGRSLTDVMTVDKAKSLLAAGGAAKLPEVPEGFTAIRDRIAGFWFYFREEDIKNDPYLREKVAGIPYSDDPRSVGSVWVRLRNKEKELAAGGGRAVLDDPRSGKERIEGVQRHLNALIHESYRDLVNRHRGNMLQVLAFAAYPPDEVRGNLHDKFVEMSEVCGSFADLSAYLGALDHTPAEPTETIPPSSCLR